MLSDRGGRLANFLPAECTGDPPWGEGWIGLDELSKSLSIPSSALDSIPTIPANEAFPDLCMAGVACDCCPVFGMCRYELIAPRKAGRDSQGAAVDWSSM